MNRSFFQWSLWEVSVRPLYQLFAILTAFIYSWPRPTLVSYTSYQSLIFNFLFRREMAFSIDSSGLM